MPEIFVGPNLLATVDYWDLPIVSPYPWTVSRPSPTTIYARTTLDGHTVYMHHLIFGKREGLEIDHIDHNGLNNSRLNVRWATHQQNMWNKKGRGASGYKGVYRIGNRWAAQITIEGKSKRIGTFPTAEEAAQAYNAHAQEHRGVFACLNQFLSEVKPTEAVAS